MRSKAMFPILLLAALASCSSDNGHVPPPPVDPAAPTGRIVARLTGVRSDRGRMMVRLYRGKKGFPSDGDTAFRTATFPVAAGTTTIELDDVPHGEYALWICHDEDANGELKTNFVGMPKEGVGVSGPPPSFIPSYDEARFTLEGDLSEHSIPMKYL